MLRPTAGDAHRYVLDLDLPESGPAFESVPPALGTGRDALALGTQLTEFTPAVSPALRQRVADTMLLAQLAADKAADPEAEPFAWYGKYVEVLQSIGWRISDIDSVDRSLEQSGADVHRAIIPVIMAGLAPGAAAASVVVAVLNGLGDMDKDAPWITLFDRSSSHARGAKFQVAHVDADETGNPRITLFCFAIDARRTITQVLFFKFKDVTANVRQSVRALTSTPDHLALAGDVIAERVRPFMIDFVRSIEI